MLFPLLPTTEQTLHTRVRSPAPLSFHDAKMSCSTTAIVFMAAPSTSLVQPRARQVAKPTVNRNCRRATLSTNRRSVISMQGDNMIDFGARDPFEGELATGFTDRPLGYADTEHQVKIPDVSHLKTSITKVFVFDVHNLL